MKEKKPHILFIRNMVCQRCILTVENIFEGMGIAGSKVSMGEVELVVPLSAAERKNLEAGLKKVGFELIENRVNKIIADIKLAVIDYLGLGMDNQHLKLSAFITDRINYEYSYLSDLFSSIEGKTIEQFFLQLRIEKVKELMVYDQLSLTEIAYQTGFSSVHHLSAQFKKLTGLTPSHFKKISENRRRSIDSI
jgi:AraC family transcriptional regulator